MNLVVYDYGKLVYDVDEDEDLLISRFFDFLASKYHIAMDELFDVLKTLFPLRSDLTHWEFELVKEPDKDTYILSLPDPRQVGDETSVCLEVKFSEDMIYKKFRQIQLYSLKFWEDDTRAYELRKNRYIDF